MTATMTVVDVRSGALGPGASTTDQCMRNSRIIWGKYFNVKRFWLDPVRATRASIARRFLDIPHPIT